MWTLNIALSKDHVVTVTSRDLLWFGAALAVALMLAAFVQVLNESVERGTRFRQTMQSSTAVRRPAVDAQGLATLPAAAVEVNATQP